MIEIGSCDLCGEFCASEEDGYQTAEYHNRLAERRGDCDERHVGPWHGSRGEPLRRCGWCAELAAYRGVDSSLDHSDCARCRAVRPMRPRRLPPGWRQRAPLRLDPRISLPGAEGPPLPGAEQPPSLERQLWEGVDSSEPADRRRAEHALRTYLGRGSVRVRWYDSPAQLGRVFDEAARAAGLEPEPEDTDIQPWSLWAMAPAAVRDCLADPHDLRGYHGVDLLAREVAVKTALIATIMADVAAPGDAQFLLPSLDAGQWDTLGRRMDVVQAVTGEAIPDGGFLRLMAELRASTGPALVFGGAVHILERPLALRLDDQLRLHAQEGPALAYADGTEAWALHGVVVPKHVVTDPGRISIADIEAQRNAEVRRVMIERFGVERFVREGRAELVSSDGTGRLWRWQQLASGPSARNWEPVVMVEVVNATPEPDGTFHTYFLRVPPRTRSARDAVAWTFGLAGDSYAPEQET